MKINFPITITAADTNKRTISGKIVPFENEVGYTSAGKVIFEKGSIEIPESPKPKLLLEHDAKKPIGRLVSFSEKEDVPDMELEELELWDSFSYHIAVTTFYLLENKIMKYTGRSGKEYMGRCWCSCRR